MFHFCKQCGHASDDAGRNLFGLEEKFHIQEPKFNFEDLQIDLEYLISDVMDDTSVNYKVFDGHGCQDDGANEITTGHRYLFSRLRPDLKPIGYGNDTRTMKVTLGLDPFSLPLSPIYQDFDGYGTIKFCVRFSLYNMDTLHSNSMEVNFLETPIQLTVRFVHDLIATIDPFNIELVTDLANQDKAFEAYVCDEDANIIEVDEIQNEGETVRVCVEPVEEIMNEGVYMNQIAEFSFYSNDLSQDAIISGEAANDLTFVDCQPGAELCAFETTLGADFFVNGNTIINGTGSAYLQFETGNISVYDEGVSSVPGNTTRHLQELTNQTTKLLSHFNFKISIVPKMAQPGQTDINAGSCVVSTYFSILLLVVLSTRALLFAI